MAINIRIPTIKDIIHYFSKDEIDKTVKKRIDEEFKKVRAEDIVRFRPDIFNSPFGGIPKVMPMGITFSVLRDLATNYPVLRSCIEYRKSQVTQLDWNVTPIEINNETITNENNIKRSKEIKKIFKFPTGKREVSFSNWIKQILEDMLVIDAIAIYRKRNRKGDVIGYLPIDAATIELILEKDGTVPESPNDAYIQKIGIQEIARLTTDDLVYTMMNPRTYNPFGFSPVETLIITITTALKLQAYNLGYLSEGNVPEGFVKVPRDIASSRDQLKAWQDAWDAMLSGDPRFQRKLKFMPEGMEYDPVVKPSDMTFERFEKWLLLNTCSTMGVAPTAIGFNFETNRSTAETSFEAGKERSLFPTAAFVKELMDRFIQEDMGYEDLEFNWTNINPTNRAEETKVVKDLINSGLMAIDEWRLGENLKPTGAKDPFIMTPVGPMFVKSLVEQMEAGQLPILPYKPPAEAATASAGAGEGAMATPNVPMANTKPKAASSTEMIDELRRWRKTAVNDLKFDRNFRDFKSDIIDNRTQMVIKRNLQTAKTKEDIEKIFTPFISEEHKNVLSVISLYDEINSIIGYKPDQVSPQNQAVAG